MITSLWIGAIAANATYLVTHDSDFKLLKTLNFLALLYLIPKNFREIEEAINLRKL